MSQELTESVYRSVGSKGKTTQVEVNTIEEYVHECAVSETWVQGTTLHHHTPPIHHLTLLQVTTGFTQYPLFSRFALLWSSPDTVPFIVLGDILIGAFTCIKTYQRRISMHYVPTIQSLLN